MRIGFNFHTSDEYISGVEYYSLGLLNALLRIDSKNDYVVFTNQPALLKKHITPQNNLTIRDVSFLKTRVQRIFWEHLKLPALARDSQLDIIHCPHYICPFFTDGLKCVVTIHDTIALDNPAWCKNSNALYYNMLMGHTIKKASKIIAVSKNTAENIKRRFVFANSKTIVIHPGIDSIFHCSSDPRHQEDVRLKYHLPDKYILFVGNIEPKKNLLNLLRAYKLLKLKGLPHKLVLAGRRSWKSGNIRKYIRSNFGRNEVVLIGYVERGDLPFIYKMADIFVFVSFCEGFGFPPLEAMTCGTAVAASSTGIMEEMNGGSFARVDPKNPNQTAESVYSLINDSSQRNRQVETAKRECQKFTWQDCAEKTLTVYKEAAGFYESAK